MSIRERMREALREAMRARDRAGVSVLRTTLAALDNAEAVPEPEGAGTALEHSPVGVGATDVLRRELSETEVAGIVRSEITERLDAARALTGQAERAGKLRAEAAALERFLDDQPTG